MTFAASLLFVLEANAQNVLEHPVELAPSVAANLRLTLEVNGTQKKLVLKEKNSNGQASPWQKFHFETDHQDPDDNHSVYQLTTMDKNGTTKLYLGSPTTTSGNLNELQISIATQKTNGWKIWGPPTELKIMSLDRKACLSISSAQNDAAINFHPCDEFPDNPPGAPTPPGDPDWNKPMQFTVNPN